MKINKTIPLCMLLASLTTPINAQEQTNTINTVPQFEVSLETRAYDNKNNAFPITQEWTVADAYTLALGTWTFPDGSTKQGYRKDFGFGTICGYSSESIKLPIDGTPLQLRARYEEGLLVRPRIGVIYGLENDCTRLLGSHEGEITTRKTK